MYTDKTLVCADCGQEFLFTASEQQFYAARQFSEPRRCGSCRAIRKSQRGDSGSYSASGGYGNGDYYWGGAASTIFWVDPREDMCVIFMTQLMPSATFNFRGQLRNLVYSSIIDGPPRR